MPRPRPPSSADPPGTTSPAACSAARLRLQGAARPRRLQGRLQPGRRALPPAEPGLGLPHWRAGSSCRVPGAAGSAAIASHVGTLPRPAPAPWTTAVPAPAGCAPRPSAALCAAAALLCCCRSPLVAAAALPSPCSTATHAVGSAPAAPGRGSPPHPQQQLSSACVAMCTAVQPCVPQCSRQLVSRQQVAAAIPMPDAAASVGTSRACEMQG